MHTTRVLRQSTLLLATSVLLLMPFTARALDLEYIKIADTNTTMPVVGGTFTNFSAPAINGYTVAFQDVKSGYTGIFTSAAGTLARSVDITTNVPGTAIPFTSFSGFSLDNNQLAFTGAGSGTQGVYLTGPTGLSKVVDLTTAIPGGSGNFTSFSAPSLSSGSVAFVGGGASQQGVYSTSNSLHVVADTTTAIPGGTGTFALGSFASPSQNFGDVAFLGGGSGGQAGVYDTIGGPVHKIADRTTAVPSGVGNFSSFGSVELSFGSDAFVNGALPGTGVYTNNGGPLGVAADTNTAIPGGTGNFTSFGAASHYGYDVAFIGNGGGGQVGLYTTTGGPLTAVVAKGSILDGKSVTAVIASTTQSINNGNLAFDAAFSDGSSGVYVAEQNYNYSANISGTWDNPANWSFGLAPRTLLYTNIHPDSGILLMGPSTSTAIRGLDLGANNSGLAELRLQPGAQLTVNEFTTIDTLGQLTLNGSVFYANYGLNNNGYVSLSGGQITGGGFYNYGTVAGPGTVGNYFENHDFVQSLNAMVHFVNGFNNFAEYQVINSQVQLDGDIENSADQGNGPGTIDIRNSILQFTNGLNNHGHLNFSFGTSDVFGAVTVGDSGDLSDGQVIISGNSNVTFYDRLIHNGDTFRITSGSTAVFFGLVSGAGAFTGSGNKIFEGGYSPGNSPAAVSLDGPVTFDASNTLIIQLGGLSQGSGYDHVQVNGQLSIGGSLQVTLINGFVPNVGATFDVLDWTSATGSFASTPAATQQGILKLFWNTTQTPTNVNLTLTRAYYDIQSGVYTQALPGVGVELVKSTASTASLTAAASYSGPTSINAGKLQFSGGISHSIGAVSGTGALQVDAGTALTSDGVNMLNGSWIVNGTQVLRSSASGGAYTAYTKGNSAAALSGTSEVSTLTFGTGAHLDLRNNALIVEATAANKAILLAQIAGDVTLGTITSSTASTNPAYGVVVVNNSELGATTFGGLAVDANSIIVTQALRGDANLDGVVNPTDLLIYAHNFNNTGSFSVATGDFNNDGVVNPTDLLIYAHNFNNNIGTGAPSLATAGSLTGAELGATATPEPASLALLGLGVAHLLLKRKRRNRPATD